MNKTKYICVTISTIISTLVIGEVLGGAVSRPIAMAKGKKINVENLASLIDVMNQRICDLEDKIEKEA